MAASLLDRAKRHLGFKPTYPSSLLPKTYLSELEKHIAQYPFDDNFTLVKQAKKGYGILTCLEEGCNVEIPLTPLTNSRDGGKGVGLGSFAAFQTHINTHPTHKRNCLRRVAKETGQKTHSGANAHVVPARGSGMATGIKAEGQTQIDSRKVSERPVPTGPIATPLARKRHSDIAFDIDSTLEGDSSVIQVTKKLKQEASVAMIPKSPLAVKTNLAVETKPMLDADEIREQLEDVIKRHSDLEVIYDRAVRKKRKTKADQTRLNRLKLDLDALRRQKDNLKSLHPGASTSKRPLDKGDSSRSILAGPSSGNVPPTFPTSMGASHNAVQAFPAPVAGPSAGNIPMPLPMSMNAPHVANAYPPAAPAPFAYLPPPIAPFAHNAGHHRPIPPPPAAPSSAGLNPFIYYSQGQTIPQPQQQSLQQQPHQTAASVRQQHAPTIPQFGSGVAGPSQRQTLSTPTPAPGPSRILNANPMARLLGLPAPRQAPPSTVPSQSKTLKPSPAGLNPTVKREIKTEQNEVSSVASSSKVTLSPTHRLPQAFPFDPKKFADSDDDEEDFDMEYDPDMVAQNVANAAMERIGIHVAPTRDARDEDGLFYGRGRDLYEGPRANPNDINKFLLLAGNAEQFDGNASVDDALKELGLKNLDDLLPGMAVALMPHQAIGVAWMLKKEKSPLKGGCMADDMGLGKTVQMITLMMMNRSTNPDCKTTLVVAPLALLDQWKMELEIKTSTRLKVLIYHGPNRPRRKRDLLEYDIVLTTYSTMAHEWPDYEAQAKKKAKAKKQKKLDDFIVEDSDEEDYHTKVKKRKNEAGLLFQIEWYRVVLDEAQGIRNRTTRSSRSANELKANLRWCLTGTPIINGLTDYYGYLRFLKVRPWYDWDAFNRHIALKEKKSPKLAVTRLQAIIVTCQIRRTKESELDGKRLIELPPKEITMTPLEFTEEERAIYTMVEARSQATFNRFLRAGTVLKNYHQVLVLLLRLRQICSHPCLIQEDVVAFVHRDEVDNSKPEVFTELTRARNMISAEFVEEMKKRFKDRAVQRMEAEKQSADAALEDEDCAICFEIMGESAVFTECKHEFCGECIHAYLDTPIIDAADNRDTHPCPKCREPITKQKIFKRAAFEPTSKELNGESSDDEDSDEDEEEDEDYMHVDEDSSGKGKGRARPARTSRRKVSYYEEDDDDDMSDFIVEDDEDEEEKDARRALKRRLGKRRANVILDSDDEMDTPEEKEVLIGRKTKEQLAKESVENMSRFLPSTKMKYMMELIEKSFKSRPDEKILVVSQWTACLTLVSDYLAEKGIAHVKYQGDMDRNKRDQAVRVFMSKDKARVMLMSLKCGGVGLNLTRANNVISLDLAWSRAVESQAWDRVHRLGQTRNVNVQRLVIANTVEDRILALQERKQSLADGSLGEGTGKKMGRLTVGELANLFGLDIDGNRI